VAPGAEVTAAFYSGTLRGRLIEGPWSAALSECVGQPVRLVEPVDGNAVDRGTGGAITLISRASLERLRAEAGVSELDARRFRMLIELDGVAAHAEDDWVGRRLSVGEAEIAVGGHVGRCLITSRDPESGVIDLPTLDLIRGYRVDARTTEPLPFGVYGEVTTPGVVRVGDRADMLGA
jgi:hypothetical protein